jgi:amino acid adenylation domain-containing protein
MAPKVSPAQLTLRVDDLIFKEIAARPTRIAVRFRDEAATYAELGRRVCEIEVLLAEAGVARGDIVGLFTPRSIDMLAAMVAVMRAGAVYLPLDPAFPESRLTLMAVDSGLKSVLSPTGRPGFAAPSGVRWLSLAAAQSGGAISPSIAGSSDDLIYLLYTSGSTGTPKGVAVTHRNVVNFLLSMQSEPGLKSSDKLLAVTTMSFDISGLELFLPLIVGGEVVIAEEADALDGERLLALIEKRGITALQATPTTWRIILDAGWKGGATFKALVGGEALPADLARDLAARVGEVWNMYGPTETTIWSACYRVPASGAPVFLGKPIANTGLYVLDKSGNPQPPGVVGEICIGGAGVAQGYWGRDDLTAERFVRDPFMPEFGRMYRTGDNGRYVKSGDLEFRGRVDGQVKIRGFRIELGEIEAALAGAPGVRAAAAKVFGEGPEARIIAYAERAGAALDVQQLRADLRAKLPHYMAPAQVVELDRLPLTPNGKVDRSALPAPLETAPAERRLAPLETASERAVASIYGEVLGLKEVGADANFFELGGHSILAIRALALLRRDLAPKLDLETVFDAADVRDLARRIDAMIAPKQAAALEIYEF